MDAMLEQAPKRAWSKPADHQPFQMFLEKQPSGQFSIAMAPNDVLMRWLPLGFYLTPKQARALADDLIQYAALAEQPGSVPDGQGGVE